jgi:hypothetical protein
MAPSQIEIIAPTLNPVQPELNGTKSAFTPSCCVSEVEAESAPTSEMLRAENPSLQVTKDHKLKMAATPILQPGPKDVLLHIKATGICGYVFNFLFGSRRC